MIRTRAEALYTAAQLAAWRIHPEADLIARWDYTQPHAACTVYLCVPGAEPRAVATQKGIRDALRMAEAAMSYEAHSERGACREAIPF